MGIEPLFIRAPLSTWDRQRDKSHYCYEHVK